MTINPAVSTENNIAWLSFASAMAVNPAAAATTAQIKAMTMIVPGVVMPDHLRLKRLWVATVFRYINQRFLLFRNPAAFRCWTSATSVGVLTAIASSGVTGRQMAEVV